MERSQERGSPVERGTVYRGTTLRRCDFAAIQRWIDRHPPLTREAIAGAICQRFAWRQPNGQWAVSACRLFLRRMARRGWLRLPPPRRPGNFVHRRRATAGPPLAAPPQAPLRVEGPLVVRPIAAAERAQWQQDMARYHDLGACALIGESLYYVASVGAQRVALLGWAAAALRNTPRDQYLGWDRATKARRLTFVVNNVRFLVLPCIRQPHLASQILGANLRRLGADWQTTHGCCWPKPSWTPRAFAAPVITPAIGTTWATRAAIPAAAPPTAPTAAPRPSLSMRCIATRASGCAPRPVRWMR